MKDTQILQVAENIWCVRRRSYLTCSYLVKTKSGAVVIDAGMDSGGADVRAGLSAAGLSMHDVKAILLTHWHNDHAAGAQVIQRETGAPVFYNAGDEPFFTRENAGGGLRAKVSDLIPEWGVGVLFKGLLGEAIPNAVNAQLLVNEGDTLFDDFEIIETFGHTPGHVSYFYRPAKALFCGDALAVINERVRFMSRPVTPDLPAARASMARVLRLDLKILCPGHREPLTENVAARCAEMLEVVESDAKWPLFG